MAITDHETTGTGFMGKVTLDDRDYTTVLVVPDERPAESWMLHESIEEHPNGRTLLVDALEIAKQQPAATFARYVLLVLKHGIHYFEMNGFPEKGDFLTEQLLASAGSDEEKAQFVLWMGCQMEKCNDFERAVKYYQSSTSIPHVTGEILYFMNNNLGYSLNQLDRYAAAEPFCRKAIELDPHRHNAHKNLGVSLAGQGHFVDAIRGLVTALEIEPWDLRAAGHITQIMNRCPSALDSEAQLQDTVNVLLQRAHLQIPGRN